MITSLNACLQRRWPMRRYLRYSIYSQKQHPFWSMGICSHHTNGVPILRQVLTIPPLGTNTCRKYLRTRRIGTNEVSFLGHSTGAPKGGSKGTCGTLYHRQFARMIGTKSLHRNSLSNCLSRLSNAYQRSFEEESIPFSLVNIQLINAFIDAGYVSSWDHIVPKVPTVGSADTDAATQVPFRGNSDGFLRVYLKYYQGRPAIRGILQISKPGKRVYLSKKKLLKISETQSWGNTKTLFVGTSRGIQTHRQILSETMHPTGPKVDTYGAALQRGYQGGEAYCLVW